MPCDSYKLDVSAVKGDIDGYDNSIREQINKKLERIMTNPYIGEHKKYGINDRYVVKVNHQRLVIFYHIKDCIVVVELIEKHDKGYRKTF
jgi:plasmid stabilization system protein ParE